MRVLVTGATGFIGRHVVQRLVGWGHEVICVVRQTSELWPLQMMPIEIWRGDVLDRRSLEGAFEGVKVAVHLVGILKEEPPAGTFPLVHVQGTRNVCDAALAGGVEGVVFLSSVGAGPGPGYPYFHTKWQAEELVKASGMRWTVLRSTVVFGEGDGFTNRLAAVVRRPPSGGVMLSPIVPVPGSGHTRFQPIWVEDVARCVVKAVEDPTIAGCVHEIGGPDVYSYEQVLDIIMNATGVHRPRIHVPLALMRPAVALMARVLKDPPITPVQLAMLEQDYVPRDNAVSSVFGVSPAPMPEKLGYLRGGRS